MEKIKLQFTFFIQPLCGTAPLPTSKKKKARWIRRRAGTLPACWRACRWHLASSPISQTHTGYRHQAQEVSLRQPNADFSRQQCLSDSSLSNHSLWFPLSSPLHNPSLSWKLRLCSSGCLCGPRWATGNTRTGGHSKHSHHHPTPWRSSSRLVLCWLMQLRCWDREKTVQRTSKVTRRQVSCSLFLGN